VRHLLGRQNLRNLYEHPVKTISPGWRGSSCEPVA
jgi:hypothetical protein